MADRMAEDEPDAVVVGGATGPLETSATSTGARAATRSVQYFCNWPPQQVALAGRLVGTGRVGLIGAVPHDDLAILYRELGAATFVDLNPSYRRFRLVKSPEEMIFTRIASRMNDAAVAALAAELRPGSNERDVAHIVESVYLAEGGVNLIHFRLTTPMDRPTIQVPHQYHPDRTIRAGDVFVTEISTTLWGYAGQILRTFTVGAEPTPRYARLHEVAREVYEAIVGRLEPG